MRTLATAIFATVSILLFGEFALADHPEVGDSFEVRADDLPAPYASESVSNAPARIRRPAGAGPAVPEGFRVNV
ncbi:MAG: sorbosone dehydrogenase, partial [Alphaproteobacteria bacterium]